MHVIYFVKGKDCHLHLFARHYTHRPNPNAGIHRAAQVLELHYHHPSIVHPAPSPSTHSRRLDRIRLPS
jgi:hypothetical protein